MTKDLNELKLEADGLNIEYNKNISTKNLQAKIDAFYESDSKAAVAESVVDSTETKEEAKDARTAGIMSAKQIIAKQEADNMKTKVIKVTMVDRREASTATDLQISNGDAGMRIPLDVFVEVPVILIELIDDMKALGHQEVDGISVYKMTKKYVIEYKK